MLLKSALIALRQLNFGNIPHHFSQIASQNTLILSSVSTYLELGIITFQDYSLEVGEIGFTQKIEIHMEVQWVLLHFGSDFNLGLKFHLRNKQ